MAQLTAETVKRTALEIYGYELSDTDAAAIARSAGPMLSMAQHLVTLVRDGIEPPFGYPVLTAESARIRK
jgi:hypothetical protein